MATIGDGFKDVFLAGVGAMAITGEKTKELVDQLIAKGELTVDQGKQINSELRHKAENVANTVRADLLEASMAAMSIEDRVAFAAKAAEIAARPSAAAKSQTESVPEEKASSDDSVPQNDGLVDAEPSAAPPQTSSV